MDRNKKKNTLSKEVSRDKYHSMYECCTGGVDSNSWHTVGNTSLSRRIYKNVRQSDCNQITSKSAKQLWDLKGKFVFHHNLKVCFPLSGRVQVMYYKNHTIKPKLR